MDESFMERERILAILYDLQSDANVGHILSKITSDEPYWRGMKDAFDEAIIAIEPGFQKSGEPA